MRMARAIIIDKDKCRMMEACRCQSSTAADPSRVLKATNLSDSDSPRQNALSVLVFPLRTQPSLASSPPENCVILGECECECVID